jgi:mannose-6-phosphate isomerase-like protein (cupin superfamily)
MVCRSNAEHYIWGGVCDGWHLLKTSGLSVIQERVPPGGFEVRHYHEHAQQFFFVLSGQATLEIDGKPLVLTAQQGVSVPANVSHRLSNVSDHDVVFLVVSAPPSHGDRVIVQDEINECITFE